jgi:hypothetical protein
LSPYTCSCCHKLAFHFKQCAFIGYSTHHKGYKCLDISTGHVYISRDVIFDEYVFPFSRLHPNAGARLRSKISLLPSSLIDPMSFGGTNEVTDPVPKSTDPSLQLSPEQASPPPVPLLDHSVLLPGSFYFLAQYEAEASTDLGVTMDSGANPSTDSAGASALRSSLDQVPTVSPTLTTTPAHLLPAATAPGANVAASGGLRAPVLPATDGVVGFSTPATAAPGSSPPVAQVGTESPAPVLESLLASPIHPITGSPNSSVGLASSSDASFSLPPQCARTRLQNIIVRPKRLFPNMV